MTSARIEYRRRCVWSCMVGSVSGRPGGNVRINEAACKAVAICTAVIEPIYLTNMYVTPRECRAPSPSTRLWLRVGTVYFVQSIQYQPHGVANRNTLGAFYWESRGSVIYEIELTHPNVQVWVTHIMTQHIDWLNNSLMGLYDSCKIRFGCTSH